MSDPTDPQSWVEKAEEDYAVAQICISQTPALTYPVIFHAQQCVEKYLKAILVLQGEVVPRIHDLVGLHNLCRLSGITVLVPEDELTVLSRQGMQVRYPGIDPTLEQALYALEMAKQVRDFARQVLKL